LNEARERLDRKEVATETATTRQTGVRSPNRPPRLWNSRAEDSTRLLRHEDQGPRGQVVSFLGVTCLSCHIPAARYDFVCEKRHGCALIPIDDKKIGELQGMAPRCPANKAGKS